MARRALGRIYDDRGRGDPKAPDSIGAGSVLALFVGRVLPAVTDRTGPVGDPHRGVALDWTVLAPRLAVIVAVLGLATVLLAVRRHAGAVLAPQAPTRSPTLRRPRVLRVEGLPVSAVEGVRFAMVPDEDAPRYPVRSAMAGAVLAVAILAATLWLRLSDLDPVPRSMGGTSPTPSTPPSGSGPYHRRPPRPCRRDPKIAAWNSGPFCRHRTQRPHGAHDVE